MSDGAFPTKVDAKQQALNETQERLNQPIYSERKVRVICIGAGASGLCFAYKLQRDFDNFNLSVYEKDADVSGTWFENNYPGCACDVPAHTYTYSFEPKMDWKSVYATSADIRGYFKNFAEKYSLRQFIHLSHQAIGAKWSSEKNGWDVEIRNLKSGTVINDFCHILVNAGGILNAWRWPAIPGFNQYKGPILHSANWEDSVQLDGKHVGLIGNGSSGIQILPAIHDRVSELTTFIRGPTWVSPVQGLEQYVYTPDERAKFENEPGALLKYRKDTEMSMNALFPTFIADSESQRNTRNFMMQQMKDKLRNPELEAKLIPDWAPGCRRMTPGINYLETLGSSKVRVVFGDINEMTEHGCVVNGEEISLDVLVCATGFDTSFRPRFPIINHKGENLQDLWSQEAKSYFGMAAADFPNYLMFLGPNCPIGNGPLLPAIESQADYILKLIDRWQTENIKTFSPKVSAVEDLFHHTNNFMEKTVFTQKCRSWYKSNSVSGRVSALWCGSTLHYLEAMEEPRLQDWNIVYDGNMFAWLGNGYSQTETDKSADWAYYVREHDDSPPLSKKKRWKTIMNSGSRDPNQEMVTFTGSKA